MRAFSKTMAVALLGLYAGATGGCAVKDLFSRGGGTGTTAGNGGTTTGNAVVIQLQFSSFDPGGTQAMGLPFIPVAHAAGERLFKVGLCIASVQWVEQGTGASETTQVGRRLELEPEGTDFLAANAPYSRLSQVRVTLSEFPECGSSLEIYNTQNTVNQTAFRSNSPLTLVFTGDVTVPESFSVLKLDPQGFVNNWRLISSDSEIPGSIDNTTGSIGSVTAPATVTVSLSHYVTQIPPEVTNLKLCVSEIVVDSAYGKIVVARPNSSVQINPAGGPVASGLKMPVGFYKSLSLVLGDSCGTGSSVRYEYNSTPVETTDSITLEINTSKTFTIVSDPEVLAFDSSSAWEYLPANESSIKTTIEMYDANTTIFDPSCVVTSTPGEKGVLFSALVDSYFFMDEDKISTSYGIAPQHVMLVAYEECDAGNFYREIAYTRSPYPIANVLPSDANWQLPAEFLHWKREDACGVAGGSQAQWYDFSAKPITRRFGQSAWTESAFADLDTWYRDLLDPQIFPSPVFLTRLFTGVLRDVNDNASASDFTCASQQMSVTLSDNFYPGSTLYQFKVRDRLGN